MTSSDDAPATAAPVSVPADPHAASAESVLEALSVLPATGLGEDEVGKRISIFGANSIAVRGKVSSLRVALHQFRSPVVYLLAAAALLAALFGQWKEAAAIAAVLTVNALIGFITEIKAARSIEGLRRLGTHSARVRRGGHTRLVSAAGLVPGDIVLVEAGDRMPADLRLIEASGLAVDESALTGESVATDKRTEPVAADVPVGDRRSMLYKGTVTTRGSGLGVVVGTGLATELGRISKLVEEAEPGRSPLEERLAGLSSQLIWATLAVAAIVAAAGIASGKEPVLMAEAAIALAVAAIPEGLPIVATLALARGMWRMARRNALVERLSAVETLGATTLILTDKTGTLTENRMTVRRLLIPAGDVSLGEASAAGASTEEADMQAKRLLEIAVLCNDATLGRADGEASGDPMEVALLRAGCAFGLVRRDLIGLKPMLGKHAFDTDTRMMATLHAGEQTAFWAVKGAPEAVLKAAARLATCNGDVPMSGELRAEWLDKVDALACDGLRVLAFACRAADAADAEPFRNLTFLGLAGLEDPARPDVPAAVKAAREAGIRVVMVTGDHAVTARSIGRAVGLDHPDSAVVEGVDREQLLKGSGNGLGKIGIFARVSPADKLALVRAHQDAGEVVAMTGDGVNDAPALKQADIGVAMGKRGTDVAREAAAMILLDDAFPTILRAIREGRVIFDNIRRFVAYLLACNLSEVLVVGLAVLARLPLPILPLQILYLNLITDVFPAFALAMGEGDGSVLKRPPRPPAEPILGSAQWTRIVGHGLLLTAGTFLALALSRLEFGLDYDQTVTVTFLTLAFGQLWHVFNMRGRDTGLLKNEITRNPWVWAALALCSGLLLGPIYVPPLAEILGLSRPTGTMWALVVTSSVLPLVASQLVERLLVRRLSA